MTSEQTNASSHLLTRLACLLAVLGSAGSVWLTKYLGLIPCPLCYIQRTFILAAAGILLLGLLVEMQPPAVISLLTLVPAVAGMIVAAFHVYKEAVGDLVCPNGLFGVGTAPQQSLAVFFLLSLLLLLDGLGRSPKSSRLTASVAVAAVLGSLLGAASISAASSQPIPKTGPVIGCRKPA
ncbi:MAG: hypothetical protein KatS3mg105_2514 [Gemmatales bacterium]|nr:MAG: hypothetical protein KatS3mg105_2514 [Gemmatales bacterium]